MDGNSPSGAELDAEEREVEKEMENALEAAKAAPYPDVAEVNQHVYA